MEEIRQRLNGSSHHSDYNARYACCHCSAKQQFLCLISKVTCTNCELPLDYMDVYDKKSWETLDNAIGTLSAITPIILFYALARLTSQAVVAGQMMKFIIEFLLIVVPTVLLLSVYHDFTTYVLMAFAVAVLISLYVVYDSGTYDRIYCMDGCRPFLLTLIRATINLLTVVCILAVDFQSFPKHFRKTRRYGVGLMDAGIGLFVFAMGAVARPPKRFAEFSSALRPVAALLVFGILRTVAITLTNYSQDEHEYGKHMNAFFTLGMTKLLGLLFGVMVHSTLEHVLAGIAVLILHEIALQFQIAKFVMNPYTPRNTLITANREGLCSLPGFLALYLLSHTIGRCLRSDDTYFSYHKFMSKLKAIGIGCIGLWILTIACIFTVSIARVTCNSGYVLWILAIALTMMLLFIIVFDLILNSLWPVKCSEQLKGKGNEIQNDIRSVDNKAILPVLVDAVNTNGLVFFILANLLTGLVNMFLAPNERTNAESFVILSSYMLILTLILQILHYFGIRIA